MSRPVISRLPFAPLFAASGAESVRAFARMVDRHESLVGRWARQGAVTLWTADRLATRLGLHPSEVWGTAWGEAA
jgi:hypothetical protein